jgi:hypothetical protein
MYYNRTISNGLSSLLEVGGALRWLFDFVKGRSDLDFLIGKNNSKEWISVFRGLSRIITISGLKDETINIDATSTYKKLFQGLYERKSVKLNFQKDIENIIDIIQNDKQFDRYYNTKKEGYYQNEFSRKYGLCCSQNSDFVIIDKEVVIGFDNQKTKDSFKGTILPKYKELQKKISIHDSARFGKDLWKKGLGDELDFLALDKEGNMLLIEYKHGTNTSGIYLSPLQIGMYFDIFTGIPKTALENAILEMLKQKQKIGLINSNWIIPKTFKDIIPILIISDYNDNSSAKQNFNKILCLARKELGKGFLANLKTYNYKPSHLTNW